jgi:RNA polymerase sigma factor (sigma-70 family)
VQKGTVPFFLADSEKLGQSPRLGASPFFFWDGRPPAASSLVSDEPASRGGRAAALSMPDAAAAQVRQRPAIVEQCLEDGNPQEGARPAVTPEQLGRWLDEHGPALVLFARQWCRSPDDVVQEAFVYLARQPAAPDNLAAWLYRVVRNGSLSAARSEGRRRRHEAAASAVRSWFMPARDTALDGEAAAGALVRLPLEEREVIVAHLWGGLTFAEIGEVVGISSSTAHRRYESGLKQLREWLQ